MHCTCILGKLQECYLTRTVLVRRLGDALVCRPFSLVAYTLIYLGVLGPDWITKGALGYARDWLSLLGMEWAVWYGKPAPARLNLKPLIFKKFSLNLNEIYSVVLPRCHHAYMFSSTTTQTDTTQCRNLLFFTGVCNSENMPFLALFYTQFPTKGTHQILFPFIHSL